MAEAQSAAALSSDQSQILIQKDVGSERWSITFRLADGYVLGNVFQPSGAVFLGCTLAEQAGDSLTHVCSSYEDGEWESLAEVTLPEGFWFPDELGVDVPQYSTGPEEPAVPDWPEGTRPPSRAGDIASMAGTWSVSSFGIEELYAFSSSYFVDGVERLVGRSWSSSSPVYLFYAQEFAGVGNVDPRLNWDIADYVMIAEPETGPCRVFAFGLLRGDRGLSFSGWTSGNKIIEDLGVDCGQPLQDSIYFGGYESWEHTD